MRIALAALFLLFSTSANAWTVVAAAAYNFVVYGTTWTAGAYFAVAVAATAYAYSRYQQRSQKRKAEKAAEDAATDRLVNTKTALGTRKLVVGRARVGGSILFIGTAGQYSEKLYMVVELASHEIDAVDAVYIDDEAVAIGPNGVVQSGKWNKDNKDTKTVTAGPGQVVQLPSDTVPGSVYALIGDDQHFALTMTAGFQVTAPSAGIPATAVMSIVYQVPTATPKASIWWRDGKQGTAPDPRLVAAFPGYSHRYEGIACLIAEFIYDEDVFQSPPTITALIRGAKVFDPRSNTTAWSDNPALCAMWLAKHRLGGQMLSEDFDTPAWIAAANACDTIHAYRVGDRTDTRKLYTCGYVHYCDQTVDDSIDAVVEAMAGRKDWDGGKLTVMAGVYQPVLAKISEDWISDEGPVSSGSGQSLADVFNTVYGTFWASDANWTLTDYPRVVADEWVTQDGGERPRSINVEAVNHAGQVQHIVGVLMRDARQDDMLTCTFKPIGHSLKLFANYKIYLRRFGIEGKEYLLLKKRWTLGGGVECQFKETGSAIFDPATGFPAVDFLPNTVFPSWSAIPLIQIKSLESGDAALATAQDGTIVTRMVVTWDVPSDARIEYVDVEWATAPDAALGKWARYSAPASYGRIPIDAVVDGSIYIVRIRARGSLAAGKWSTQNVHKVLGKSAPPPMPLALTVIENTNGTRRFGWEYQDPAPRDLAGFELRYASGTVAVPFDGMIPIAQAAPLARSIERSSPAAGAWVFAIAAFDTSGNLSTPRYHNASIQPPVASTEFAWDVEIAAAPIYWVFSDSKQDTADTTSVTVISSIGGNSPFASGNRVNVASGSPNVTLLVQSMDMTLANAPSKSYRISLSAVSDGVVTITYRKTDTYGGAYSAAAPLPTGVFTASQISLSITTTGTYIADARLSVRCQH